MNHETVESRVARLEQQMSVLMSGRADDSGPAPDEWQGSVGMFRGDPVVQEMIEEARRMREEDRRLARTRPEPGPA